jgi:hypothetical protein
MKTKSLFLSLFLVSLSVIGYAQDASTTTVEKPKAKIWFGPKFGLDLTNFTTNVTDITNQLGTNYQAGLLCQIGEKLYLQPEIYYASYKTAAGTADSSRTNFIKAPIMLGVRILDIGLVSVHIMGGPQFSLQLDNKDQLTGAQTLTWQVGAGADVLGFITADLRYTIQSGSIATQVQNFSLDKTGLNLTVGLKFR